MKAIFLDRDGTLGGSDQIEYPGDFGLYPGVQEKLQEVQVEGIKLYSFTNQPGIAEGRATIESFREELYGFGMDGVYVCPHLPVDHCNCRKPKAGMIELACRDHELLPSECCVIGDRLKDMTAAGQAGCMSILVQTGAGKASLKEWKQLDKRPTIDFIAEDIIHALNWLTQGK
ncbi:HAD-IIIA family hydrolase [Halobacillus shinanisalinarum]|uniref:D,D-heptose 1,7-bisphosphate phosphatase n=1 Tax=Halobacillus shinanisalinarum TaxID=2932258 RepID=A0ABY4GUJ3_9BACI|nr:HAD-IIIA family hydrolase [Halobacillus shinanisalinarum]UOQ91560.1 HAD-IIIA family hydrolase [Halobacillus shinanisalinarum]